MKIWLLTMECAGIQEAGGVKDVSYALVKGFAKAGCSVTLFMPFFGCAKTDSLCNISKAFIKNVEIPICNKNEKVSFSKAFLFDGLVEVIFVEHPSFDEKKAVYVYTQEDENENPRHIRGNGHEDSLFIDTLFSKSVAMYSNFLRKEDAPDIVHCHDASTAVFPCYASLFNQPFFEKVRHVVTIHNAGPAYHHEFKNLEEAFYYTNLDKNLLSSAQNGKRIEPFLLASTNANLTTVSTFYAEELCNPANNELTDGLSSLFAQKGIKITGITNGIDYSLYRPEKKKVSMLPHSYCPKKGKLGGKKKNRKFFLALCKKHISEKKLNSKYLEGINRYGWIDTNKHEKKPIFFMYHGRLVYQKGIPLLLESIPRILNEIPSARFFIVGQGETQVEEKLKAIASEFNGKVVFFNGYNAPISRLVAAASDFALIPSLFEPCCLEDLISQVFGTIPIAHSTGGLKKIIDEKSGFLFMHPDSESLIRSVHRAKEFFYDKKRFASMIFWTAEYVSNIYSWDYVIQKKYLKFFKKISFRY